VDNMADIMTSIPEPKQKVKWRTRTIKPKENNMVAFAILLVILVASTIMFGYGKQSVGVLDGKTTVRIGEGVVPIINFGKPEFDWLKANSPEGCNALRDAEVRLLINKIGGSTYRIDGVPVKLHNPDGSYTGVQNCDNHRVYCSNLGILAGKSVRRGNNPVVYSDPVQDCNNNVAFQYYPMSDYSNNLITFNSKEIGTYSLRYDVVSSSTGKILFPYNSAVRQSISIYVTQSGSSATPTPAPNVPTPTPIVVPINPTTTPMPTATVTITPSPTVSSTPIPPNGGECPTKPLNERCVEVGGVLVTEICQNGVWDGFTPPQLCGSIDRDCPEVEDCGEGLLPVKPRMKDGCLITDGCKEAPIKCEMWQQKGTSEETGLQECQNDYPLIGSVVFVILIILIGGYVLLSKK